MTHIPHRLQVDHVSVSYGDKILIALSGGVDSVFLLRFLHKYTRYYKIELFAFHINHQLRGKSADTDELFCKSLCDELHIPFSSAKADIKKLAKENKQSIEEAGRNTRYALLKTEMLRTGCTRIATAHHMDDNLESVLMNLVKGCGVEGLRGIAPMLGGIVIRPLLGVSKTDIVNAITKSGFAFRADETNSDNTFERNKTRNQIIPLLKEINPALAKAVARLTENAREVSGSYEVLLREWEQEVVERPLPGKNKFGNTEPAGTGTASNNSWELVLKTKDLAKLQGNAQTAVIRHTADQHLKLQLSKIHCDAVRELIPKTTGAMVELPKGYTAIRERGHLLICKQKPPLESVSGTECHELTFEKGIIVANLGLNPSNDGIMVRVSIPALTEDRRKDIVKKVKAEAEHAKVAVRNIRKEIMETIKRLQKEGLPEDEVKVAETQVQKNVDEYIKKIDTITAAKEVELMTV